MSIRDRLRRTGRTHPCPCGSGRKYKRCCLERDRAGSYTQEERGSTLAKLDTFVGEELGPEDDEAWLSFFGRWQDRLDELDAEEDEVGDALYDMWFCLDFPLGDGRRPVDAFLEARPPLTDGERRYLELLRETTLRLYEVADAVPGVSLRLRDVVTGASVDVRERLGRGDPPAHAAGRARHRLRRVRRTGDGARRGRDPGAGPALGPGAARNAAQGLAPRAPGRSEEEFDRTTRRS